MGAPSRKNIRAEVFEALGNNPNCEYSYEQLEAFFSQTSGADKTTSKRRTSAFDMWKKLSKEEKEDLKWSEYKTTYPEKAAEFQAQADEYNKLHFEDKPQKSSTKKNNNDELKKEIAKLKKTNKTDDSPKSSPPAPDEPEVPAPAKDEPEVPAPAAPDEPAAPAAPAEDEFDKIDVNNDGVISRDEFESYVKEKEEKKDENEDGKSESGGEAESGSEEANESEEEGEEENEEEDDNSNKPVFKKKITIMNQYKEWKKNELGIEADKSIPGADFKEYKIEDNFTPDDYDESKPWFEYIQKNMIVQ